MNLTYHLETEERKGKYFLIIQICDQGRVPADSLPLSMIALLSDMREQTALKWLLQQQPHSSSRTFVPRLAIPPEKAQEAVKLLSLTRKVYWGDQRVVFDPFSNLRFSIQAEELDTGHIRLTGMWTGAGVSGSFKECDELFLSDPPLVLKHGTIYAFDGQTDREWYDRVYPEPSVMTLGHFQQLHTEWNQDPDGAPLLHWIGAEPSSVAQGIQPLPYLVLTDRTGAFANLWMDYGVLGKVDVDDFSVAPWRKQEVEKSWERDLLETDFLRKQVGQSHYYCPLHQVGKSLTFLLEIGWTIIDHQQRKVVQQHKQLLYFEESGDAVLVTGTIDYASYQANVTDVIGAFNRRERFLALDPHTVGLIDHSVIEEHFGSLGADEIVSHQIAIKKTRMGLLEPLLNHLHPQAKSSLAEYAACLSGNGELTQSPPTELFKGNLFPYQQMGLNWLCFLKRQGLSGLLADEMGLGKTVQVLAFFSHLNFRLPSLIVAPTSLLFNWRREIEHFLPDVKIYVHHGKERLDCALTIGSNSVILTSYALLRQDQELLQSLQYELVVLDEGQFIKNSESQSAQAVYQLSAQMRLLLSGTPIENRWEDLWSLFHFLLPDLLEEKTVFSAKMAAAASDHRYLLQTQRKIRPFLLRRKKQDVALQLPEKMIQTVWVEMPDAQRLLYEAWVKKNQQGLLKKIALEGTGSQRMEILEAILRLRQICCHPWLVDGAVEGDSLSLSAKLDRLIADVSEVVAEGKKVLIYSQFTQMLRLIEQEVASRFGGYVYLDGSTHDRESIVQQFQEDPHINIFLISLKAGGVGLNLTAADYVFLYDPWWNEAVENQAIDRAHRLGRKDVVIARRYITAMSIEEKLMRLKEHKRSLSEGLLEDHSEGAALSLEDLKTLLT